MPRYSEILREKYDEVGNEVTNAVHLFANQLSENYLVYDDFKMNREKYGEIAYKVIKELSASDPDERYLELAMNRREGYLAMDEDNVRYLYTKYLVDPCKQFKATNDNGWLQAFRYDKLWINVDRSDEKLYNLKKRYKVCNSLVNEYNATVFEMLKKVIKH